MFQVSGSGRSSRSHTGPEPHRNGSLTCTFDRKWQEVEAMRSIPDGTKYGGGSSNGVARTGAAASIFMGRVVHVCSVFHI